MSSEPKFRATITKKEQVLDWYERGETAEEIAELVELPLDRIREIISEAE